MHLFSWNSNKRMQGRTVTYSEDTYLHTKDVYGCTQDLRTHVSTEYSSGLCFDGQRMNKKRQIALMARINKKMTLIVVKMNP